MKRITAPAAALLLSSAPVMASTVEIITPLPFAPEKEAFLEYMSGTYEGLEVEFFEAKNCSHPKDPFVPGAIEENSYACDEAYYRTVSPLGTEVCRVTALLFSGARRVEGKLYETFEGYKKDKMVCRFKD